MISVSLLKDKISQDVKSAMREKDRDRLAILRLVTAAIKQREVDRPIEQRNDDLTDDDVLSVLLSMIKQREKSAIEYRKYSKEDRALLEEKEIGIISVYLPPQTSEDDVLAMVEEAVVRLKADTMKDMGRVMADLKPSLQGTFDLSKLSQMIKAKLSS